MPVKGAHSAHTWRRNALFRVLAFLDSTGLQAFDLREDIDDEGLFRHPEITFGENAAIREILQAGVVALRENIGFLFTDEKEREALLQVVGAGPRKSSSAAVSDAPLPEGTNVPTASSAPALPEDTRWSRSLLSPKGLPQFVGQLQGAFTLGLMCRLEEALAVPTTRTVTEVPFVEQFFVDAVDQWMSQRTEADNQRLVLACGVQPAVLEVAAARKAELPFALTDFVVDVVFPSPEEAGWSKGSGAQNGTGSAAGDAGSEEDEMGEVIAQDWLLLAYQHNHETVDVEEESSDASPPVAATAADGGESPAQRVRREEATSDLAGWQPEEGEDGEVVLTADNIDRYMRENPSIIPVEIVREKRKLWKDPSITAFELEHHYTLPELKAALRELAALAKSSAEDKVAWENAAVAETSARVSDLESTTHSSRRSQEADAQSPRPPSVYLPGSLTPAVLKDATRVTKKADIVGLLLRLHSSQGQGEGTSSPIPQNGEETDTPPQQEEAADEPTSASASGPHIGDPSLSAAQLMKHFTLAELTHFIVTDLGESSAPATKKKCAALIVAKRRTA